MSRQPGAGRSVERSGRDGAVATGTESAAARPPAGPVVTDGDRQVAEPPRSVPHRNRRVWGVLLPLLGTLILIAVWWGLKILKDWPTFILPSPGDVASTVAEDWDLLVDNMWATVRVVLIGFASSVAIAVPIGIVLAYSWVADRMFSPILFGFNAVPKVAIAPILVVWMGFSDSPKVVMVILLSFFPIALATAAGLSSTPQELRELLRSLDASPWQGLVKLRLRWALPQIFVGLKLAISLAVIGAVIAEFVGSTAGLGYLILVSGGTANTSLAFASLTILALISVVLFYGLLAIERLMIPWAEET